MPSSVGVAHVGKMTIKCVWSPQALAPAPLRQVSASRKVNINKYVIPNSFFKGNSKQY